MPLCSPIPPSPMGSVETSEAPVHSKENYKHIISGRVTPQKPRPDATLRRIVGNYPKAHGDKAFSNLLSPQASHAETSYQRHGFLLHSARHECHTLSKPLKNEEVIPSETNRWSIRAATRTLPDTGISPAYESLVTELARCRIAESTLRAPIGYKE